MFHSIKLPWQEKYVVMFSLAAFISPWVPFTVSWLADRLSCFSTKRLPRRWPVHGHQNRRSHRATEPHTGDLQLTMETIHQQFVVIIVEICHIWILSLKEDLFYSKWTYDGRNKLNYVMRSLCVWYFTSLASL